MRTLFSEIHAHAGWQVVVDLLGLRIEPKDLTFVQMGARTLLVFVWSICLLRLLNQRVIGRNSGMDVMLLVLLGSVLSRAINGSAALFPTLGARAILVVLYRVVMAAAFRSHAISVLTKGNDSILVQNGQIDWDAMRRSCVTLEDLMQHVRLNGNATNIEQVREARLERSGGISVIRRDDP